MVLKFEALEPTESSPQADGQTRLSRRFTGNALSANMPSGRPTRQ
jgi:hypothetical protein